MRLLCLSLMVASSCMRAPPPGQGPRETSAIDAPANGPAHAPIAGAHRCPQGTAPLVERQDEGEALRSCVLPGREYRNTPFRHGPYEVVGADGKLKLQGEWRDGKQHGIWRAWHANGVLHRETTYENGVPRADTNWDDAGRPLDRRDATGTTTWYPNGRKKMESRVAEDGALVTTTWYENGAKSKVERTQNGQRDGLTAEWFESGAKMYVAQYRMGKLVSWHGWSSNGEALADDGCVDDADCVTGIRNECYQCVPRYEAMTRWRQARRLISPPPPPRGCPPGPFPCAPPPASPSAQCRQARCMLEAAATEGQRPALGSSGAAAATCGGTTCKKKQYCITTTVIGGVAPPPGQPAHTSTSSYCADSVPTSRSMECQPPDRDRRVRCRAYAP